MSRLKLLASCNKSLFRKQSFSNNICLVKCMSTCAPNDDTVTHTGQKWDKDDYRLVRFTDKPKQVNPSFAINLIDEVPPKPCKERVVWCDGGGGPIGHPKVYINLDKPGNHACGYCGLRFYLENHH
ncbi:hypothetical protein ILUMI_27320 [Ignelater luminosus]|uniref:NADH dehydrogenase [ubiquinone] iron-sulfur protein 6, mitochondrial n=1 Tax=Ignelater luminosus TaxID=2038154 RepID=A0A8K0C5E1_IGNLU|nr:hypothetical protein ILUMI_27320 [Ignelater luminosus]